MGDASIPPLPPSNCRLPQRTYRDLRTSRMFPAEGADELTHVPHQAELRHDLVRGAACVLIRVAPVVDGEGPASLLLQLPSSEVAVQAQRVLLQQQQQQRQRQ